MSDPAELPRKKPRATPEQQAEWDAAFAAASGTPPPDPEAERVYGNLALVIVAVGTVSAGSFAWDWPTFALSICFMSATVGGYLARRSSSTTVGRHARRWSFWMFVALVPGTVYLALLYCLRFMQATSLFNLNLEL